MCKEKKDNYDVVVDNNNNNEDDFYWLYIRKLILSFMIMFLLLF